MEASVDRISMFDFKTTGRLTVSTCIQSLSSKIHSGLYDIVAIRKMKMSDRPSGPSRSPLSPNSDRTEITIQCEMSTPFQESSFRSVIDPTIHSCGDNDLLRQFFDLSVESFQIQIHPDKRDRLLRDKFFETTYIFASEADETSMLVSAEYVAAMFTAVGIFDKNTTNMIAKFKPFHFGSDSAYKLPLDLNHCVGFERELYIFQDYPLISTDVSIMAIEELPEGFPKLDPSSLRSKLEIVLEIVIFRLLWWIRCNK
jgi:hypothetical protein